MGQSLEGRKKSKTSLEKEGGRERERKTERKTGITASPSCAKVD